ncbi:orotidine 5'-phosphate decarboxylase [Candidatus Aerophobetes bacterium]|nr:orotidine 5'-phosphate decarboxylase [Candidatus Aerophobetes bacterium]
MEPVLQVALDFVNLKRALGVAKQVVTAGADWLEAGTPLIKSEGIESIRLLRKNFPQIVLVADLKIMDVGRIEAEIAFKAGADMVCVMGVASDSTIQECVEAARNYGGKVVVDLMNVSSIIERAKEVEEMGVDFVEVHISIDDQMRGKDPVAFIGKMSEKLSIPVAVAGGINSETAAPLVQAGAKILIVGGAICKAKDPADATCTIKKAMREKIVLKTELFKRVSEDEILSVLEKISTANLSDAMHRSGELVGFIRVGPANKKMMGKILTIRTYPGDWAKPVEAIDRAKEGEVLFIDVGGAGPAVWGELATHSAVQKRLAGVVINGAVRDVEDICRLNFPVYAKIITPCAGEPKGFGEIGIPLKVDGRGIFTGDWVLGDEDGLVVIPGAKAVEIVNRAMDVLERENRIREEINEGGTLSSVMELLRWEKERP